MILSGNAQVFIWQRTEKTTDAEGSEVMESAKQALRALEKTKEAGGQADSVPSQQQIEVRDVE